MVTMMVTLVGYEQQALVEAVVMVPQEGTVEAQVCGNTLVEAETAATDTNATSAADTNGVQEAPVAPVEAKEASAGAQAAPRVDQAPGVATLRQQELKAN